ncbi:MAG: glycosyltransferase [Desulfobacterales bacterium]|nr:glycosyltransferase [Desulfobacterales bacterium]
MSTVHQPITVLMAVYNGEKTIRRAIESILNQTFQEFEFLIVNDCSTDHTIEIIQTYKDSRIRLYNNHTNIGQTKSLNIGLNEAKGEYIARIDADDYSLPQRLAKQYKYIFSHPEYDVVGTDCAVINEHNEKITIARKKYSKEDIIIQTITSPPLNHVSVIMKKKSVLKVGGYDPSYKTLADYHLWSKLIISGFKFANLSEVLTVYTISNKSYGRINANTGLEEKNRIVYQTAKALSNYSFNELEIKETIKLFDGNIIKMTDSKIKLAEKCYTGILLNLKPDLRISVSLKKIKSILEQNYLVAAYHYLLKKDSKNTRKIIVKFIKNHGLSFYAAFILILSLFDISNIRKLNYLRAKFLK